MGRPQPDRQLRDARAAYLAAVRRLSEAMVAFDESGMPMDPGPDPEPYPWTAEHVAIITTLHLALGDAIDKRRRWDRMRRGR